MNQPYEGVIYPALEALPRAMGGVRAALLLHAIALQESRFEHRQQIGGPARGFWQFELGTEATRGGMYGVFLHPASSKIARALAPSPEEAYQRVADDDILACQYARLLLWTDPRALPAVGDELGAWACYLRNWRPGKPHPETWAGLYRRSMGELR